MHLPFRKMSACQTPTDVLFPVLLPLFLSSENLWTVSHCFWIPLPFSYPDSTGGGPLTVLLFSSHSPGGGRIPLLFRSTSYRQTSSTVWSGSGVFSQLLSFLLPIWVDTPRSLLHLLRFRHPHSPSPGRRWSWSLPTVRFSPHSALRTLCRLRYSL